LTGDEDSGNGLKKFVWHFSNAGSDGIHIEDEFAIGEEWFSDESAVEVIFPDFDVERAANEGRERGGGVALIMNNSCEVFRGDFFEVELSSEVFEGFEVGYGKVEVLGGEGDSGCALAANFGIEVAETIDEGIDGGFLPFGFGDGSRVGCGFGECFVCVGLLFEAVSGGGNKDEHDHGHHDKNEAAGEGRAGGILWFGSGWGVGHGVTLNKESGRLNSEL